MHEKNYSLVGYMLMSIIIYRDTKRRDIYLALDTDPEGMVVLVFTKIIG